MDKKDKLIEKQRELIRKCNDVFDLLDSGLSRFNEINIQWMRNIRKLEAEILALESEQEPDEKCKHPIFSTHTGDYCYCLDCESIFISPVSFPRHQENDSKDEPTHSVYLIHREGNTTKLFKNGNQVPPQEIDFSLIWTSQPLTDEMQLQLNKTLDLYYKSLKDEPKMSTKNILDKYSKPMNYAEMEEAMELYAKQFKQ
jgi:hypothetical protein